MKNIFRELDPIFHPRSVALIGASAKQAKVGRLFMDSFIDSGFRELYPVNPGEREILGFPAYPSVLAIPHPVDMAVVVTPTAAAPRSQGMRRKRRQDDNRRYGRLR